MFQKPTLVLLLLAVAACATTETPPAERSVDELYDRLALVEASLLGNFMRVCEDDELELEKLREEKVNLESALADSEKQTKSARSEIASASKRCDVKPAKIDTKKLLLGEVEDVMLKDHDLTLEARIDTGAETSSLGVFKLTKFERDGKDWVKFRLKSGKKTQSYEYPVHDDVRIKQREEDDSEARFEIELDIKVGGKTYRNQLFNLSSRRHYDFQILIGRSFLRDIAVVDVGTKHQLKRK